MQFSEGVHRSLPAIKGLGLVRHDWKRKRLIKSECGYFKDVIFYSEQSKSCQDLEQTVPRNVCEMNGRIIYKAWALWDDGKHYRALDKVFRLVASSNDLNKEQKSTLIMMRVDM